MRIALVQAPMWAVDKPPLGLACLAATARQAGHVVDLFDFNVEAFFADDNPHPGAWESGLTSNDYTALPMLWPDAFAEDRVRWTPAEELALAEGVRRWLEQLVPGWAERVLNTGASLVGLTAVAPSLVASLMLARELKRREPGLTVIFGGVAAHPQVNGPFILRTSWVDGTVQGEGERVLLAILERMERGRSLCDVPGLGTCRDGEVTHNPPPPPVEPLDELPFPDFEGLPLHRYALADDDRLVLPLHLTRGCPYRCSFCIDVVHWGRRYRMHSPRYMLALFDHLRQRYGCRELNFNDLLTNAHPRALREHCEAWASGDVAMRWFQLVRVVRTCDGELFEAMRRAGCVKVDLGIESGSDRVLRRMDKRYDRAEASRVIRAIHDAGLLQSAIFIVGYPGETGDDLRETIDFVAEHRARLSDVFAGSLVLLRGTPLWERREELEIEIIPGIPSHPAALRATCALYTFPHANWRLRDGTSELAQREARRERLQAAARELGVGTSSSGAEVQHLFD